MNPLRIVSPLVCSLLLLLGPPAAAGDWGSWRGPTQDGRVAGAGLFRGGASGLELTWKRDIGIGYSGVAVSGKRLVTMLGDGTSDLLAAFDVTSGEELWRFSLGPMYEGHDGGHDGPPSTPVVEGDTVFALGADGLLVAVGLADGKELWRVRVTEGFRAPEPFWGFCTTPVVVGDRVVVQVGDARRSLAAFHTEDGRLLWTSGRGSVDYRSPIAARLAGRQQVIAGTSREVSGVDPATGSSLWTLPVVTENSSTPVVVGERDLLLLVSSGSVLYRFGTEGAPRRLWRSREFRSTYAVPVAHDGFLYGFTDRFLTCVNGSTGRRVWRSRIPGGKGLIVVDGHLVILGASGDVVVADATPEGYRERTRCAASDADGYSWPSFAGDTIYVRNLKHLAAVRCTGKAPAPVTASLPEHRFGRELARIGRSADPMGALDAWMKAQESFPVVEDDRWVHFVYRGDATDVGIRGNHIAHREEDPLRRLPGTDLFHRSYPIEPGARWEYQLNVDYGEVIPDPRNPRRALARDRDGRPVSEVVTSGYRTPAFVESKRGESGRTETFHFSTRHHGNRRVHVVLPPGYDKGRRAHPVLVVTEGDLWTGRGALPDTARRLGDPVRSPILAFLHGNSYRELGGATTRSFAAMLARELVPELDRRYRIVPGPGGHGVLGRRGAAVAAVATALEHPEVFGRCIAISYGRADTVRERWIARRIEEISGPRPEFYVGWNRYDIWRPQSFDVRAQSRALAADLRRHGFEVHGAERLDGAGWKSWRILAGEGLAALYPAPRVREEY